MAFTVSWLLALPASSSLADSPGACIHVQSTLQASVLRRHLQCFMPFRRTVAARKLDGEMKASSRAAVLRTECPECVVENMPVLECDGLFTGLESGIMRRQVLSGALMCLTVFWVQSAPEVLAEESMKIENSADKDQSVLGGILSIFDSEETTKLGRKLPKAYLKSARGVVKTLRESFTGDSKLSEAQFRRNADSAKEAIRDYVANWRGSTVVSTENSYQALEKALRVLGEFYSKKGPRAVLPDDVRSRVLEALRVADDAL